MTTLEAVERLALELPEQDRATLAAHMLGSLPALLSEADCGIAEADRRDLEMDADPAASVSLEDFDLQIRSRRTL